MKAVSDLIAPLSGEVLEVNDKVVDAPETVNEDPYGDGWLVKIRIADPAEADALMDAEAYKSHLADAVSYLSLTDADREEMLATIGVSSVEELFRDIPEGVRFEASLDLEPALSEQELVAHLDGARRRGTCTRARSSRSSARASTTTTSRRSSNAVLSRGEFLTAYTPYQPEMSQGVLQAIFEYQTAICELTGMDVSNASGYDGTTVAADACYMAKHATGRSKIVVTEAIEPAGAPGREDLRTRFRARGRRGAPCRRDDRSRPSWRPPPRTQPP